MTNDTKNEEQKFFTDNELSYLKNPLKIEWERRSTIKRRLVKKISYLSKKNFRYALDLLSKSNLISEKEKYDVALNFFLALKPSSIRKLIKLYTDFEKVRDQQLKIIKGWNEPKELEKKKSLYERNSLSICILLANKTKYVKDIKDFNKKSKEGITSPEMVLKAKFTGDWRYICSSKSTKNVYYKIKKYRRPVKIKDLLSKFKQKREKEIIEQFYIRGILLEDSISWETFLKLCMNLIKKGEFAQNIQSKSWIEYDLDVFNVKGYEEKKVILPKIYKNIDFKRYSLQI